VRGKERPLVTAERPQGEVEFVAENQQDDDGTAGIQNHYESQVFKEILRVRTAGDVYDPDLLSYRAMVGGGLTQYLFKHNDDRDRGNGTLTEYDITGDVLREKRYPISLHFDKSDDLIPRQFASSLRSKRQGAAGSMAWRDPNWPMFLQVSESETRQQGQSLEDQDLFVIDDERLSFSLDNDGGKRSQLGLDLQSNDVAQSRGGILSHRQEDIYTLNHVLGFGDTYQNHLDSFLDYLDQGGDSELQRLLWQEQLRLRHSQTLLSNYRLIHHQSERPAQDNRETRGEAQVQHRLYDSLVSTGKAYLSQTSYSSGSDMQRVGAGGDLDYTKKNRWGTLMARYGLDVQDLEQTGGSATVSVVDERHPFTVTGSLRIVLNRTNIDAGSIVVLSNDRIRVYNDYTVSQTSGITEILIIPGGDIVSDGDQVLSFDYDFITDPERQEQSWLNSFQIRERLHNGVSCYYEYRDRHQHLESQDTTIVPDEFQINLFGVDYVTRHLRLLAEHRIEQSTRIPSRGTRVEGSYLWALGADTRFSVYASNSWIDYTGDTPYDVVLFTMGAEAVSNLTSQWELSGRFDYRDEDDSRQGKTRGLHWDIEGKYRYRQLDVKVGVEYNALDRFSNERRGWLQYLRVKRMF
jgi:hypothetical protein